MERKKAVITDVAVRAGVAPSSVSRVLNGKSGVSDLRRNRVLDAVAALGFERDPVSQSLRTGRTMSIGFVVPDISNPLIGEIALAVEQVLHSRGYTMLLMSSLHRADLDVLHLRTLDRRRVDGVLLSMSSEDDPVLLQAIRELSCSAVVVDRDIAPELPRVVSDHQEGLDDAVRHLVGLGHRRIALINGTPDLRPSVERTVAFRRACREGHAKAVVRDGFLGRDHGYETTIKLLASPDQPTAIIVGGNQVLRGVLEAIRDAKRKVPRDLSLISCDDVSLSEFLSPPLATIVRDTEELGRTAAELLLDVIDGGKPRSLVLSTSFRSAASCGRAPSSAL